MFTDILIELLHIRVCAVGEVNMVLFECNYSSSTDNSPCFSPLLSSTCPSATGSVCNLVLMRNSGLKIGIEVVDEKGEAVGITQTGQPLPMYVCT